LGNDNSLYEVDAITGELVDQAFKENGIPYWHTRYNELDIQDHAASISIESSSSQYDQYSFPCNRRPLRDVKEVKYPRVEVTA